MANAPDTSSYILVNADDTLPASRILAAGTGLSLQDTGNEGSYTIEPLGNLVSLYNYTANGYMVYDYPNRTFSGRSFSGGSTISISNADGTGGNTTLGVINNTSIQQVHVQQGNVLGSTRDTLNFIPGTNMTITVQDNPANGSADITLSMLADVGGGTVTSVAATSSSTSALNITGSPILTSGTLFFDVNENLEGLSELSGTGFIVQTGSGTFTERSIEVGSSDNLTITDGDGVSGSPTLDLSSTPTVTSITITNSPVSGTDGTNKEYVDALASGITFITACLVTSASNLSSIYVNGTSGVGATLTSTTTSALTIDGVSLVVTNRVLLTGQTSAFQNGIYTLTTQGDGSTPWVLTRSTDYDTNSEILPGNVVPVTSGTQYGESSWLQTATVTTMGTSSITFAPFTYSPSAFLQVANNLSDLDSISDARDNLGLTNVATQNVTSHEVLIGGTSDSIVSQALSNGQVLIGSTGSSPVSATLTEGTGIDITNGSGSITVGLSNTTVTAGPYTSANITVNAQGQITAAADGASGGVTEVLAGTGLISSPVDGITTTGTIGIASTGVTAAMYEYATITVNAQGQITAAESGSSTGGITDLIAGTNIVLSPDPIIDTGTISLDTSISVDTIYLNVTLLP